MRPNYQVFTDSFTLAKSKTTTGSSLTTKLYSTNPYEAEFCEDRILIPSSQTGTEKDKLR
jgi:hypothetical protein